MPFSRLLRHTQFVMWKPVQSVPSSGVVRVLGPALLVAAGVAASNQPATDTTRPLHYSHRQLQAMLKKARTDEDHDQLADYFRAREREFRAREAYEQQALTEYWKDPAMYPSKYPTPGDTAKVLASYYHLEAQKSAGLAVEHARRATDLPKKK